MSFSRLQAANFSRSNPSPTQVETIRPPTQLARPRTALFQGRAASTGGAQDEAIHFTCYRRRGRKRGLRRGRTGRGRQARLGLGDRAEAYVRELYPWGTAKYVWGVVTVVIVGALQTYDLYYYVFLASPSRPFPHTTVLPLFATVYLACLLSARHVQSGLRWSIVREAVWSRAGVREVGGRTRTQIMSYHL